MRGKLLGAGGDGGIDIEQLTASPSEVLEGQVFYGEGSEDTQTGTMENRDPIETADGVEGFVNLLKVYLKRGAYLQNAESGYPEVHIPYADLVQEINLVADAIRNGTTIAGVTGTYGNDGNLTKDKLVAGQVGYGANGRVAGEAVDRGAVSPTIAAGETYNIAKGFYDNGQVKAKDLASQTGGTAGAGDILKGKTAWVNGNKVTGNIVSKAAETFNVSTDDREIPAARYTSGKQTIKGVKTENISAGNIKKGVRVRVGDANNMGRIADITGTFAGMIVLSGWWYRGTFTTTTYPDGAIYGQFVSSGTVYNQNIGPGTLTMRAIDIPHFGQQSHTRYNFVMTFGDVAYIKCEDPSHSGGTQSVICAADVMTVQIGI